MPPHHRSNRGPGPALAAVAIVAAAATAGAPAAREAPPSVAASDATLLHVLNRLTFGPRPGDLERMRAQGLEAWIDAQLQPRSIAEPALDRRLAALPTLGYSTTELLEKYELPPQVKREVLTRLQEQGESPEDVSPEMRRQLYRELRNTLPQLEGPPRRVLEELQAAKLLRAVYAERQLEEVLVDFWINHFNVYAQKGPVKLLLPEYERAIRAHALGRFEDLLGVTAESPAMLFYLDNWLSVDPAAAEQLKARVEQAMRGGRRGAFARRGGRGAAAPEAEASLREALSRRSGLNENYARELLELHTLGVDGGYTQQDVREVARVFTGWTIRGLRQDHPAFAFDARVHDHGDKHVLGRRIEAGGVEEGRAVLHLVATHPSTARFLAYKLARRLVADTPPEALVERAGAVFLATQGDIRQVVRTIATAPEFLAPEAQGAKVKTPLEFVASALRASAADVRDARELNRRLAEMGMPLYLQQPPTGYKDTADAWVSTSGLVARLNFALDLAAGRLRGVRVSATALGLDLQSLEGTALAEALATKLVPAGLGETTRATLESEAASGRDAPKVAGLILGSPEFQKR
jgi:uncharacterized protein (DUF1800 family)